MAVNNTRGMNAELAEGMSDSMYKKVVTGDRGGVIDAATFRARASLDDIYYGYHELRTKILPDGTAHTTPDFTPTPTPDMLRW